jgi:hypothetical protein
METALQALAGLILQARIEGGQVVRGFSGNRTVAIVTLTRKQTRLRGMHAVVAVSAGGEVVGRLLRATGAPVCDFTGGYDFDTACVTVAGCGLSGTACT